MTFSIRKLRFLSSFHLDCFYFTNNDGCINNTCLATYYINAQDFSSVNKKSHFIIFLIFNFICQEFILFASVKYLYFLYWNKYIHAPEYYLLWIYWCNRKVIFHSETIENIYSVELFEVQITWYKIPCIE